jgi:uncharacterized RDD family membrane protein YckC
MARQRPADESLLFDLPLDTTLADRAPAAAAAAEPGGQPALPLLEPEVAETEPGATEAAAALDPREEAPAAAQRGRTTGPPRRASLRLRLAAGLTDFGFCAAVAVLLLVALLAQGVRPVLADWPAGALFLLTFSFLYSVLPLAFWGRTPGMTLAGLRTSSADGRPLTFRQSVLNWLGGVLTVTLAGLPLLLALGGRSLSDLMSGARTMPLDRPS